MKKHRLWIFRILAVLLPFMVIMAAEAVLRLCHYGYDTRLFIPAGDKRFLVMNRDISKKYFTVKENATIGKQEEFYHTKKRESLRFFVLGASSSLGFPYMHNGAFPRMLKYRLQFEYPNTTVEIINLSLTAINSYTLYDFAQVADYQPDGIIIYAGHNEYYGALGVASSSRLGSNPAMIRATIRAKEWKLMQLVSHIGAAGKQPERLTDASLTLMERMAAGQVIDYGSEPFFKGIEQFDRNMQALLHIFRQHDIPVFIGTLASNLEGQEPLGKAENALAEFNAGKEAYRQSDYGNARQHFLLAKEYDNLRFRAPEAINEKIRSYPALFPNVRLVDIHHIFNASAPHGIPGTDLILEHVHPNLEGHRIIADAFFESLQGILPEGEHPEIQPVTSRNDYPFTAFDTIYGRLAVEILKRQWPFNETTTDKITVPETPEGRIALSFLEKKINWGDAMQQLYDGYMRTNNYAGALRIIEGMCLEMPYDASFAGQAGKLCMQLQENEKAYFYFLKEYELKPSADAAANLAVTLLKLDQPAEAAPFIDAVLKYAPQRQDFSQLKSITQKLVQTRKAMEINPSDMSLRKQTADLYLRMGNKNAAAKYEN